MLRCTSRRRRSFVVLVLLFGLGSGLFGCGGSDTNSATGEWTVEDGALTLERDLLAGDDEEFYFGSIADLAVREDGRTYVVDRDASHVKVLAPDGILQDTVGRRGDGPGEFKQPSEVFFAHGDSLYVLHGGYFARLAAFGPNHEFAYEASFRVGEGPAPDTPVEITPIPGESEYLAAYSSVPLPGEELTDIPVRRVGLKGTAGDTLFTYPPAQQHIEQNNGRMSFYSIPFARGPRVAGDEEGNMHYAWSDSLGVRTYGPEGELRRTIDIPFEPVPVTGADRERALEERPKESRMAVEGKIPETKPAFEQFLVDDEGRYWFGRPTATPDSTDWWVAMPEEQRVVTATLPSEVELLVVKNGQAYGRTTTENGAPVVVRYQVHEAP